MQKATIAVYSESEGLALLSGLARAGAELLVMREEQLHKEIILKNEQRQEIIKTEDKKAKDETRRKKESIYNKSSICRYKLYLQRLCQPPE